MSPSSAETRTTGLPRRPRAAHATSSTNQELIASRGCKVGILRVSPDERALMQRLGSSASGEGGIITDPTMRRTDADVLRNRVRVKLKAEITEVIGAEGSYANTWVNYTQGSGQAPSSPRPTSE